MRASGSLLFLLFANTSQSCLAYSVSTGSPRTTIPESSSVVTKDQGHVVDSRRQVLARMIAFAGASLLAPQISHADIDVSDVEMKEFVDPYGLFSISVPNGFYTLRRKAKGDLPDEKTGKGRRGSSIFTAGNMAKAEVIAVERFPTRVLLEENGIEANGSLSTFPDIGEPLAVANLINLRREKDKPGVANINIDRDSVKVSDDGKVLTFKIKTEIEVQKPELLLEQYGVSKLFRTTLAKASLESTDGNLLAVFASALETDFNGPDGASLQASVDSFKVVEREFGF
uniref:PsbP C-terminal domain-containing protein n=1 Tax=Amphora coffeiformis TaxID=265554 RepID=A0A7S3P6G9_9STRA